MNDKELYREKFQAQLDEWKADIAKLKARASVAKADAQLAMREQVGALERGLADGQAKLSELSGASEDAWDSVKKGAESVWDSLRSGVREFTSKFKD
ncbi:MAG: coiled coil domain-containing protein [Candidatus Schekmanbacteria bacterium]|nr:coiled coil domain-containing protein [Candidatus Schekmanbacteria bacterium]